MQCKFVRTLVQCMAGLVLLGGALGVVYPAAAPAQPAPATPEPAVEPVLATLIELHNQQRHHAGLPRLTIDSRLMQAAQVQVQYMAEHTTITHQGHDGTMPAQRVKQQGYDYVKVAENVAGGLETPAAVLEGWMQSPPHRQNILGSYTHIGAARATGADGRPYWCVVFGVSLTTLDADRAAATVVTLLNQHRAAAGLPPLALHPGLAEAAMAQAQAMAAGDALPRQQGKADLLQQQLQQTGYHYLKISQSAVSGAPTPEAVVQNLLDNPAYKHQALGDFTQVGVGYAIAEDSTPYWSILFAVPSPHNH